MAHITTNIQDIYTIYWGRDFSITPDMSAGNYATPQQITVKGDAISEMWRGKNIFLPVRFEELAPGGQILNIRCCTIRATSKRTIVRTPVPERIGSVKEVCNIGDWVFTIKGVLLGDNDHYPDNKIHVLREIYESLNPIELHNPLRSLLTDSKRVIIESLDFEDLPGRHIKHQPFTMVCETDIIDNIYV
ncbi:MAG: DUF6046 domain-containing protein [Muribaculaceae bacterium]